jgi:hypothetical protein
LGEIERIQGEQHLKGQVSVHGDRVGEQKAAITSALVSESTILGQLGVLEIEFRYVLARH